MKRTWMSACGLLIIFLLLSYRPVNAQSDEFSATVSYAFGQQFTFEIQLPQPHQVESLTIFLSAPATRQFVSIDLGADFLQESPIRHSVSVAELALPPFAELHFSVELHQKDGSIVTLPEQSLFYEDDRVRWRRLERAEKIVYWQEGESDVATATLSAVDDILPVLQERIPAQLPQPLRIYLYPSAADLRSALRLNGYDWSAGVAIPELGVILLTIPNPRTADADLQRLLPHELTHLLLYQAVGADYESLPVWFDEGLATMAEEIGNPNQEVLLARALDEGTTLPFDSLCQSFPTNEGEAVLAYAQSAALMQLIEVEFGRPAIARLLQAFSDGASCESATRTVLGLSLLELEQLWLEQSQPQDPISAFLRENLFWLVMVGAFGVVTLLLTSNPVAKKRRI